MNMTDNLRIFYAQSELLISRFRQTCGNILTLYTNNSSISIFSHSEKDENGLPVLKLSACIRYSLYDDSIAYEFTTIDDKNVDPDNQAVSKANWWDTVNRLLAETISGG